MSTITTPKDLIEHLSHTDAEASTLDQIFDHCAGLTNDEHAAWVNFHADYVTFSVRKHTQWGSPFLIPGLTLPVQAFLDLRDDDDRVLQYEHALADWHAKAEKACGLKGVPGLTPRDDPSKPQDKTLLVLERIAIAGGVIVGGVVLLTGFNYLRRLLP